MVEDKIEREILIAAPLERVWAIITRPEHVGKWFSDAAEIDLRPGGAIVVDFGSHGTAHGIVERVDKPHAFSYRWNPGEFGKTPTLDETTLVEFTLTPHGEHTRVRVVESGFSKLTRNERELGEQFKKNDDGWTIQLRDLNAYVEELSAQPSGR